jgi:hypothetical protein
MTYTIALVACSAAKLGHAAPARELYTSQLFKKAAAYAQRTADEWFILSAEHGLVHPDTILEPYDTKLTAGSTKAWAARTREQLESELNRGGAFELVVLAGKHYRTAVEGLECTVPMQGLGIGQQLGWLTQQLEDLGPAPIPETVTDAQLHELDDREQASLVWYLRGWLRNDPEFQQAMQYAYAAQLRTRKQIDLEGRL